VRPVLDPARVVEYLSFGFVSGAGTLLKDVWKLPPGHALRVQGQNVTILEYWDALSASDDDIVDPVGELEQRLDAAVAASLVSDVPVSLMLSGGLDSSAIAALAARHIPPSELTAYSVSFGLPDDESHAAARLAAQLGLRHREIHLNQGVVGDGFDAWLGNLDVPSANPTWVAVSCIARAVREDGIKVLLSGDGGDELFGGYNRWMKYLRFHDQVWEPAPNVVRRIAGAAARPFAHGLGGDIARRARHGGQLFVGSRPFHDDDLVRCLGPVGREAALATAPEAPVARIRGRFEEDLPDGDQLAWMSYLALKTDLVEDYLVRLDTLGMAESVEGRVPLLDAELVRFALSLSQEVKIGSRYEQKALLRRATSSFLPAHVTRRPKQGFCPPVADWAIGLLRPRLNGRDHLITEQIVDERAVSRLTNGRSVKSSFALWALGTLMVWCDVNL
jgi:asparagine synthase (glutamine-hydrolysing)